MAESQTCAVCGGEPYIYFPSWYGLVFCRAHSPGAAAAEPHAVFLERLVRQTEEAHYAFLGLDSARAAAIAGHIRHLEDLCERQQIQLEMLLEGRCG